MALPSVLPSEQHHTATSDPFVPTIEANHVRLQGLYVDPQVAEATEKIRA